MNIVKGLYSFNRTNINWFVFHLIQSKSTKSTKVIDQSSLPFLAASLQLILSQQSAVVAAVHVGKFHRPGPICWYPSTENQM